MLLQQVVNGIMLGSTYSLMAIGYTLVLGVLNMLNLAHGDIFMIGAFLALAAVVGGMHPILALLLAMAFTALVSLVMERVSFRPLRKADMLAPLLSSIAFGMVLQNVAILIWGSQPLRFPAVFGEAAIRIGPLDISLLQLFVLGTTTLLMLMLVGLIQFTKIGLGMRATSERPAVAQLMGVKIWSVITFTFLVSGALAGAAGVLTAMTFSQINAYLGVHQGLKAMVAMVIGGIGDVRGAMVAGLLLGLVEVMTIATLGASYREIVLFGLLMLFLWFRPGGLFQGSASLERV